MGKEEVEIFKNFMLFIVSGQVKLFGEPDLKLIMEIITDFGKGILREDDIILIYNKYDPDLHI